MNFFERQDEARRNSRLLLWLFFAAVAGIVAAVDLVASGSWIVMRTWEGLHPPGRLAQVPAGLHVAVVAVTLFLILAVCAVTTLRLRAGGGGAVARMMGGRVVRRGTEDPRERRLLNVVEEMAIASGTRVPEVYVLDAQRGINAFTAGHDLSHTAVAVTRGALEALTRDELQGVIGHEFSHVVNGDMALNIRMVGVLSGIVWIGGLGEFVMRAAARARDVRATPVALVGFLLWVIGSVGLLCSRIIKAMLSRERELLADAGGVQFTRNPDGLAGALDQIRCAYSWVAHRHTEDVSHLFFADGHGYLTEPLFATHPPLDERIKRIAPGFVPSAYRGRRAVAVEEAAPPRAAETAATPWPFTPAQSVGLVGAVGRADLDHARRSLDGIPPGLRDSLAQADGAAAAILALLMARDETARTQAMAALAPGHKDLAEAADRALPAVRALSPEQHLALVDLALPSLRARPASWREPFGRAVRAVLASDRRVSVHGFALGTFVRSQLEAPRMPAPARYRSLAQLRDDAAVLISLVAHAGCGDPASLDRDAMRAFEAGTVESGLVGQVSALRREACTPEAASGSLERLQDLPPLDKARLVKALFAAITADGVIRPVEAALMRMIGGVLDCPMPPLMTAPSAAPSAALLVATAA